MTAYDFAIVGGGILGLATAYRLLQERPGASLVLLEKEGAVARHQSGHNSGVIHAGVYYPPGSLKARLCRAGVTRTVAFAEENDVPYLQCGKLVVAVDETETERLDALQERATANGVAHDRLGREAITALEPNIAGVAALLVHETGIVDYPLLCRRLADHVSKLGGELRLGARVRGLRERGGEIVAETEAGAFAARQLIVCAGLQADRMARLAGLDIDFRTVPFRGEYYRIADSAGVLATRLIYPVPDPMLPFLGVHLTRMIGGYLTVGPNAVLSLGRETYDANVPVPADMADMMGFPGLWRLLARYARAGLYELRGSLSQRVYLERCRRYCPALQLEHLQPYRCGIRAQNVTSDGKLIDDFLFLETARSLHVCNAPSPAATSALPIADEIVARALKKCGVTA